MPIVQHLHDWAQISGGLQCLTPPCTAFFSPQEMQANLTNAGSTRTNHISWNEIINQAYKKAGH